MPAPVAIENDRTVGCLDLVIVEVTSIEELGRLPDSRRCPRLPQPDRRVSTGNQLQSARLQAGDLQGRWARAALEGAQTLFIETGPQRAGQGKMEGFIGLTPATHQTSGDQYHIVDILSHAMKGDIVVQDGARPIKISFFDLF